MLCPIERKPWYTYNIELVLVKKVHEFVQLPQPVRRRKRSGGSACRARLRGKRVKSAFFETCGQPPEKEEKKRKNWVS